MEKYLQKAVPGHGGRVFFFGLHAILAAYPRYFGFGTDCEEKSYLCAEFFGNHDTLGFPVSVLVESMAILNPDIRQIHHNVKFSKKSIRL